MLEHRVPGGGKYALLEREQRWLLTSVPAAAANPTEIYDRYILGTRLRLRRAENAQGVAFKLGQKVRVGDSPERVMLTNIYLSSDEYAVFLALDATELRKTRRHLVFEERDYAVDVFPTLGLVLAEVELSPNEERLPLPDFADLDVTDDERYSGGALAAGPK